MSEPVNIDPTRLTRAADAVALAIKDGKPADGLVYSLCPPFKPIEIEEAIDLLKRLGAFPSPRAKKA